MTNQTTDKKKKMCFTKAELRSFLLPMSHKEFRELLNPIIARSREITLEEAKRKTIVNRIEACALLDKVGNDHSILD